ncbi:hypothetical protein [Paraclostridium sordellii]|uniref:hypothetical protein n=1 Tax=Paraclostridium sordellii TaxID=1505 RepID=UPI000E501F15|nr:hypothetical protein [Paeniclostridium sordellii]RGX13696.1 hypothetical protein DWV40_02055 [Paeniclostridium sordellii]
MVKNEEKIELCRKYRVYLEMIFILGNNVMLQKQFYDISKKLNISISDYQTRKALDELEKAQIIKKQNFLYSKNKVIVLKKFAIRFLLNKESSNQVASTPKRIDNRVITSVFKVDRIIKIIDAYEIYGWDNFLDKMYDVNSSLIYNKSKGIFYHEMLINKYNLNLYEQEAYLKGVDNYNKMLNNLEYGRNNNVMDTSYIDGNGCILISNNINKARRLENATIDTLLNSNIHIQSITDLIDTKIIEVVIMDVNNSQNINKIIDNIIISCIVLRGIFKESNIEFRFKIVVWDAIAKENVKCILNKKNTNEEYNYIRNKLNLYRFDGRNILLDLRLDINDIKISLCDIDIYKKYLGNLKLTTKI